MSTLLFPAIFDHNWASPITVEYAYYVDISTNLDGSEQRYCKTDKTKKTISISGFMLDKKDSASLYESLIASHKNTILFPALYDEQKVSGSLAMGSVFIPFDTTKGKFAVGQKAIIVDWNKQKRAKTHHVVDILSISPSGINVAAIPIAFSALAYIYPLAYFELNLSSTNAALTDELVSFDLVLIEKTGSTSLANYSQVGVNPLGEDTWKSLPIFNLRQNWNKSPNWSTVQNGQKIEVGTGNIIQTIGEPKSLISSSLTQLSKSQANRLLSFFESRGGSTYIFWYPLEVSLFFAVSKPAANQITLEKNVDITVLQNHKLLSFWLNDGSCLIRGISSIVDSGSVYTVTLNENLDISIANLARISFAFLARFNIDSLKVTWLTTTTLEATVEIISLPLSNVNCTGTACEGGNCEGGDCPDPGDIKNIDPILPPWEPSDPCPNKVAEVPMYYDVTNFWNSGRDIVRAADLGLPPEITIGIKKGFVPDPLHPSGGSLSSELKSILYGTHLLSYQGLINRSGKSRNPYHLGRNNSPVNGSIRSGGELVEDSPYWQKTVAYSVSGVPHTVTFRFYAEFVDHTTPSDYGAWGTIFVLFVYSTEVSSYVEGTPFAAFNNNTFTISDPLVYDKYSGGTTYKRYCHPKTILMAVSPTSFHNPLGTEFFPKNGREKYREPCWKIPSVTLFAPSLSVSAVNNAVFGLTNTVLRCLASFGGWTKSEFFPWLCAENEAGEGFTALKATNPGWTNPIGGSPEITVGLNDLSIDVCSCPDTDVINPCIGHPDEPCAEYGGTPACYRNETPVEDLDFLCFSTTVEPVAVFTEACASEKKLHGTDCSIKRYCNTSYYNNTFSLELEDFELATVTTRFITWRSYYDDPDYVRLHFPGNTFCASPTANWSSKYGGASIVSADCPTSPKANITASTFDAGTIKNLFAYATTIQDGIISVSLPFVSGSIAGIVYRLGLQSGTGIPEEGYFCVLSRPTSKLRIFALTAVGTFSLLEEKDLSGVLKDEEYSLSIDFLGSKHKATLKRTDGSTLGELEIQNCLFDLSGSVGTVTLSSVVQQLNNFSITDKNWEKKQVVLSVFGKDTIDLEADPELLKLASTGSCATSTTCTPCTPCLEINETVHNINAADSTMYPDGPVKPKNTNYDPPSVVGECNSEITNPPPCGDCPPPFIAIDLTFPPSCGILTSTSPWFGGFQYFLWSAGGITGGP